MPFKKKLRTSDNYRIVIADHQALVRSAIRLLLETKGGFFVVAEAGDGRDTLEKIIQTKPDIALLDVAMPTMDGIEVTKRVRDRCPGTRVLALTALEGEKYVQAALAAGASGYVPKSASAEELMEAIRIVASGRQYVHPRVASMIEADGADSRFLPEITSRETEVVRLIALGYSHKEVAARLNVGVKTVETHKSRAMQKLGISGRADLLRVAAEKGWIILGDSSDRVAAAALLEGNPGLGRVSATASPQG